MFAVLSEGSKAIRQVNPLQSLDVVALVSDHVI